MARTASGSPRASTSAAHRATPAAAAPAPGPADGAGVRGGADFPRLGLGGRAEPEPAGHGARPPLGKLAPRRAQPRHGGTGDPPQKVRLVLLGVAAAVQGSVAGDHVVPG